jgi:Ca2+-transporting ATPase
MAAKNNTSDKSESETGLKTPVMWHTKTIEESLKELGSDPLKGLSSSEAKERIDVYGYNEIKEKGKKKPVMIFLSQFNDFMIWILIAAAFISGIIIREITDAIVILIILIINAVLGFVQEYRAEKALEALKELAAPTALVIRDGKEIKINSRQLVPGDIIKLFAGDHVPADARVLSQSNLLTDEALITGESLPVEKHAAVIKETNIAMGDKKNIVFSGTTIVKGRCHALVVESGENTEIGKIASMVQEVEEVTPLQKQLKSVGKKIGMLCIVISLIVFVAGMLKGNTAVEMLLVAVALAVAAIPEILKPAVPILAAPHSKLPICAVKITAPLPGSRAFSRCSNPSMSIFLLNCFLEMILFFKKSTIFLANSRYIFLHMYEVRGSSVSIFITLEIFFLTFSVLAPDRYHSLARLTPIKYETG